MALKEFIKSKKEKCDDEPSSSEENTGNSLADMIRDKKKKPEDGLMIMINMARGKKGG
jgi:hypothetical protein